MRRLIAPVALLVGLALAAGVAIANTGSTADAVALAQASSLLPEAHWKVAERYLDFWGSEVDYGHVQLTNVAGPSWVVELTAPGDSNASGFEAAVVISAFTGDITDSGASRTG